MAGSAVPIYCGEERGDAHSAARGRGAAPPGRRAQAGLAGPRAAGGARPTPTAGAPRAPARLPTHPACLAPAPGEEVDPAAPSSPAAGRRASGPDRPARRREPSVGVPPRARRAAPTRAQGQARPPCAASCVPPASARRHAATRRAASGPPSSRPIPADCLPLRPFHHRSELARWRVRTAWTRAVTRVVEHRKLPEEPPGLEGGHCLLGECADLRMGPVHGLLTSGKGLAPSPAGGADRAACTSIALVSPALEHSVTRRAAASAPGATRRSGSSC
jgi:hypothetical protein